MGSILNDTKQILGIEAAHTEFDLDILIHINSCFSTLNELGVGPDGGFFIEDATPEWEDFVVPANQLHMSKLYIYLKTRYLFDPPGTSFHLEAMKEQIAQFEWRLNMMREVLLPPPEEEVIVP